MTKARSGWIAFTYVAVSFLIGPLVAFGGFAVLTGDGDECDRHYQGNLDGRATEYMTMNIIHFIGGGIMLAIGIYVLALLWRRGRKLHPALLVLLTFGTLFMMLGYSLLVVMGVSWRPDAVC